MRASGRPIPSHWIFLDCLVLDSDILLKTLVLISVCCTCRQREFPRINRSLVVGLGLILMELVFIPLLLWLHNRLEQSAPQSRVHHSVPVCAPVSIPEYRGGERSEPKSLHVCNVFFSTDATQWSEHFSVVGNCLLKFRSVGPACGNADRNYANTKILFSSGLSVSLVLPEDRVRITGVTFGVTRWASRRERNDRPRWTRWINNH